MVPNLLRHTGGKARPSVLVCMLTDTVILDDVYTHFLSPPLNAANFFIAYEQGAEYDVRTKLALCTSLSYLQYLCLQQVARACAVELAVHDQLPSHSGVIGKNRCPIRLGPWSPAWAPS